MPLSEFLESLLLDHSVSPSNVKVVVDKAYLPPVQRRRASMYASRDFLSKEPQRGCRWSSEASSKLKDYENNQDVNGHEQQCTELNSLHDTRSLESQNSRFQLQHNAQRYPVHWELPGGIKRSTSVPDATRLVAVGLPSDQSWTRTPRRHSSSVVPTMPGRIPSPNCSMVKSYSSCVISSPNTFIFTSPIPSIPRATTSSVSVSSSSADTLAPKMPKRVISPPKPVEQTPLSSSSDSELLEIKKRLQCGNNLPLSVLIQPLTPSTPQKTSKLHEKLSSALSLASSSLTATTRASPFSPGSITKLYNSFDSSSLQGTRQSSKRLQHILRTFPLSNSKLPSNGQQNWTRHTLTEGF